MSSLKYPFGLWRSGRWSVLLTVAAGVAATLTAAEAGGRGRTKALTPTEALAAFQIEAGLRVELVAAEPLVVSPVAFAFDERGRLFVVEGRGYPEPIDGKLTANEGRVVLLEDTDGDGRMDKRTEFATGLGLPNGIAVWRGGVFVTCAPDILYLKDNDGDGVADERRVVLTGFDTSRTSQLRVSSPTLGRDGLMYVASGLNGGKVTSPLHPERAAVSFSPADGRFDPDTFLYESTGGRGQFGLSFDGFGRRFVSSNRHPVLQVVLEPWHLKRNPRLTVTQVMQEVSKVEAEAKVWPISRASVSADFIPSLMNAPHSGTFTSACSVLVYGGTGLSPDYQGNVFICEPAQNLVQRQILRDEGASFRAEVAGGGGREFLASSDTWFRPVFLAHGPDGALYVADMHRREIDHPSYVPEESRGGLDFTSGKENGRIYRIVRAGGDSKRVAKLAGDGEGLVRELDSPEAWRRETAHRLLLEHHEAARVPSLEKSALIAVQAEARVRARWLLRGLGGVSEAVLAAGLSDKTPAVREQTALLVAEYLSAYPDLLKPVLALANDADARVRFAGALTLATSADARVVGALAEIAARDGEDRWTRAAVLTGVTGRLEALAAALRPHAGENPAALAAVRQDLGRLFGVGAPPEECRRFLSQLLREDGPLAASLPALLGLAEGWRTRPGTKAAGADPFAAMLGEAAGEAERQALGGLVARAAALATAGTAPLPARVRAVSLLGWLDSPQRRAVFGELLDARQAPELQLEVVRALERIGDPASGALLLAKKNWTGYSPQVRAAVIATVTGKPPLLTVLFDAIAGGTVAATEIPPAKRAQLMRHATPALRERAEAVFKPIDTGDRMQVYRAHRDLLALKAEAAPGREIFLRVCSACHTRGAVGGKVGPDLTGIRHQPADALLLHILVPNYEVAPAYQAVTVETRDGRTLTGWVATETESALTLRTAFGTDEVLLRSSVASLSASGVSLMPEGLEQTMSRQDLANLIAYLKSEY
ncbi:MAG: c-type cytochrome [Verrucomicrobia bacterium]|nr:c-type cytochrome [Verrucomicrobiota bacterium]